MPEDENYGMYLSAFVEDITNLDYVVELDQNDKNLVITLENESYFDLLNLAVKNLLNGSFYDKLAIDSGFSKVA